MKNLLRHDKVWMPIRILLFSYLYSGVISGVAERRLLNDLMEYYQKLERPVANESEAIMLKFGLTLQQIMDVVGIGIIFLIINIIFFRMKKIKSS